MHPICRHLAYLIITLTIAQVRADSLSLLTEELPPLNMLINGKIVGISADKVTELMKRSKVSYTLDIMPWARGYQLALDKPNTCVFSTTRTPERETRFKWIGPLTFTAWVLYGLAERQIHLNSLEDARPYRIGTYNADVLDVYLRARHFKVESVTNDSFNPRKLLLGRIDLWASGPSQSASQIVANGWTDRIVPVLTFNHVGLYLACNPGTPSELVNRLNVILQGMTNDGTATLIERRYEH